MAADLAALPPDGRDGRRRPIAASTGAAKENRKLVEKYGIRCTYLMQEQMEVAARFRAQGTPMGYRIDKAGRIAGELATGAEPLLQLFALNGQHTNKPAMHAGSGPHGKQ